MFDDTAVRASLPPAMRAAAATVNGATVDTMGAGNFFRSAMAVAYAGAITDGTHTPSLQDSDDGTTWANVPADLLQGAFTAFATASQNTVQRVAYLGSRRYLRVNVTTAGVTTGGLVGALVLLSSGSGAPVS